MYAFEWIFKIFFYEGTHYTLPESIDLGFEFASDLMSTK
jgi:hypothetical protein